MRSLCQVRRVLPLLLLWLRCLCWLACCIGSVRIPLPHCRCCRMHATMPSTPTHGHPCSCPAAPWCDIAVIWARNTETGSVNAFIVRKGNPGYACTKIENKIALRCVQNGDIHLTDCFVPDADRLPGGAAGMCSPFSHALLVRLLFPSPQL